MAIRKEDHRKKLTKKQKDFLQCLEDNMTNVSRTCEAMNISRPTHYDWLSNLTYKEAVQDIEESMLDFGESCLYKNMQEGKEQSILFYLKTRAKKRGYVERSEVEHIGDQPLQKIEVEFIKNKDKS